MGLKSADVVVRTNITVSNDAAIFRAWKKKSDQLCNDDGVGW